MPAKANSEGLKAGPTTEVVKFRFGVEVWVMRDGKIAVWVAALTPGAPTTRPALLTFCDNLAPHDRKNYFVGATKSQ